MNNETTEIISYNPIKEKQSEAAREFVKSCFQQIAEMKNDIKMYKAEELNWHYQEACELRVSDKITIRIEKTITK